MSHDYQRQGTIVSRITELREKALNLDCILNYISASTLNIMRVKMIRHFAGDHFFNDIYTKVLGHEIPCCLYHTLK